MGSGRVFGLILLVSVLCLAGCKTTLYSDLSEKEINEMLATLLNKGIDAEKVPGNEGMWTLLVEESEIAASVEILQSVGFPKDRFASIGEIFEKEGLVSSPLEERIRFIYALSQELSETISLVDGVIAARVHIVIPENDPLSRDIRLSSASVFIKHRIDADMESRVGQIKRLVINSIEGLSYDKVTVVLFPSYEELEYAEKPDFKRVLGIRIAAESSSRFWMMVGTAGALFVLSLVGAGYLWWASRRKKGRRRADVERAEKTD